MGLRALALVSLILTSVLTTRLIPGFSSPHRLQSQAGDTRELLPGASIERELKGREAHSYRIALDAGQFTLVAVEPKSIDTVVTVTSPDGRKIIEMSVREVSIVAEATGQYLLQVRAREKGAPAGRYEIRMEPPRPATAQDQARASGERSLSEGERLYAQATATSFREAIEKFQAAVSSFHEAEQPSLEAFALLRIGDSYLKLPDGTQMAREYFTQTLALARTHGDRLREAQALMALGRFYRAAGEPQRALGYYDPALKLYDALGNLRGKAITLHNMGNAFRNLEDFPKALDYYDQALATSKAIGDRSNEARIYNDLGLVYRDLGDLQKALESFHRALPLSRSTDNPELEFMLMNNMGIAYKELGEYQKALESYEQSLPLSRNLGNVVAEAQLLNNIGNIYKAEGENQTALDYYNQALPIFRRLKMRGGEAMALNNIGSAYSQMGEYHQALDYHEQSRTIRHALGDRRGEASSLNQAGRAWHKLGDLEKARETLRQALDIRRQLHDPIGEAETLWNLAAVERDRSQWEDSRTQIEAALQITESVRAKISDAGLRASYLARVQERYGFYVDLLMRQHHQNPSAGYEATALQAAERGRARVLLESLVETRADIRQGVDPALVERERSLQQQLNVKADRLTQRLSGKYTEEQKAVAEKEVSDLLTQYQDVQAQIRATSPRYAALTQPQPLNLKEIQQQVLDDDTILLEYALGEDRSFLWAVTPTSLTSFELPKRVEIEATARRVYDLLIAQPGAQYPQEVVTFSQTLLGPVAEQLGKKRLLIVADGALQYVPFAALPAPRPSSVVSGPLSEEEKNNGQRTTDNGQQPLVVDHEVVSLPSASVLAVLRRELVGRSPAPDVVAVLADPVFQPDDPRVKTQGPRPKTQDLSPNPQSAIRNPQSAVERSARESGLAGFRRLRYTRREAEAITAFAPVKGNLKALDFMASKAMALGGKLSRYRVVHFATHGLLNSAHPELSGIVLSLVNERGQPQDGFLRAHEVYNLNLPAELVVLSGCKTGLGKEIRGEGLVGLTRGFMYAGAPRVVVSVWNVSDAGTSELMRRFYQRLLKDGMRPTAALREAQVSMWQEKRWQAPYYWAGFVFQGEWR